jgi:hypothetical protein
MRSSVDDEVIRAIPVMPGVGNRHLRWKLNEEEALSGLVCACARSFNVFSAASIRWE